MYEKYVYDLAKQRLATEQGPFDLGALINAVGATTTQTSADQTNNSARGIKLILQTTVIGTGSITLSLLGKDQATGQYYLLLAGAAVITNATNVYTVYPGAAVVANVSANDALPATFHVVVTANNANAATYRVGACLLS